MKNKKQKGFTLIEFLVAGAIFVVILSIVTTIIVRSMQSYNRMIATENVNDEVRYALDTISRAVRVSKIESGGISLVISGHPTKGNVTYSLVGGVIQENSEDITSGNITVDTLNFTVSGLGFEGFGIGAQPKVTITIKARSSNPIYAATSEILVQTTVEQKALDVSP